MNEKNDNKKKLEALLFASGRAMSTEDLSQITGMDKRTVKKNLLELKKDYFERDTSLALFEEGDSWKLNIRENYVSLVTKIVADTELNKTVLETLGVIAWKAPVLQSEVINVRSGAAYDHIKELVELGFIRKEKEGRSYRLRLTEKFFEYFDVPGDKGIKDALKEVKIPKPLEPKITKLDGMKVVDINDSKIKEESDLEKAKKELEDNFKVIEEEEHEELPEVDNEFLSNINSKIENISQRNDEHDKDELFKRPTLDDEESEQDQENQESDEESNESVDESVDESENQNVSETKSKSEEIFGSDEKASDEVVDDDLESDEDKSEKDPIESTEKLDESNKLEPDKSDESEDENDSNDKNSNDENKNKF